MQVYTWWKNGQESEWQQTNIAHVHDSSPELILGTLDVALLSMIKSQNLEGRWAKQSEDSSQFLYDKNVILHQPFTDRELKLVIDHPKFINRTEEIAN